ncbi:MAG: class II fructose-bisphosphate aldolase [Holosporales bacterium]|nr:class II fructose-bisphosphate aldolase [Holosporales bacterium]
MKLCSNLKPGKELLEYALSQNIAIGAFNFSNMETIQAIVEVANEVQTPVILQVSESAIKYMGMDYVCCLVSTAAQNSNVPLAFHLDHGKDFEICKKCVDSGFTSVMIDGSSLPFEANVERTKEVVEYAKERKVSVEAELGILPGIEDDVKVLEHDHFFTDPDKALEFIEKTGVESLAISIGTSHGLSKAKFGSAKLNIKRLKEIKHKVGQFPLVLHGASSVYQDIVAMCNDHGADIKDALGIQDVDIIESIRNGIVKINVDTDIRLAFMAGIRKSLQINRASVDIRKHLSNAKDITKEIIKRKMKTFIKISESA